MDNTNYEDVTAEKSGKGLTCPLCGKDGFNDEGLRNHLQQICMAYWGYLS